MAAAADGRVLGAVLLLGTDSDLRQVARADEAEFRLLGVSDLARGKGIGRALVHACLDRARARGARAMVLTTQPTMRAAHRVYEDLGFTREPARDWDTASGSSRWVYSIGFPHPQM